MFDMRKFEELVNIINTKHPEWRNLTVRDLKDISGYSHDTSRLALNEVRPNNDQTHKQKIVTKSTKKNPSQEISFIDDPNELLLSVAIRELNKPNPDPRWASILINCKKEKITNTNEVIDQFKNLPTAALVNLLNKSSQEEY